jgi:membrane protein implicated in regulation of membrane protease activity
VLIIYNTYVGKMLYNIDVERIDDMSLNPTTVALLWSMVLVAAITIEFITPNLNTLWFAVGAAIALLMQVIGITNVPLQVVVFLSTSFGLIIAMPRISKKFIIRKDQPSNISEAIGKEIIVLKGADKNTNGEGKYNSVIWTLVTEGNDVVKAKDIAVITGIKGNKLIVKKVKEGKK